MLKVHKWKEKRTQVILKNKQKTNTKMLHQKRAHSVGFFEKLKTKTKPIAVFVWTPNLQTLVLGRSGLVPSPRKGEGSLW